MAAFAVKSVSKKISENIELSKLVRFFAKLPNPAILGGSALDSQSNRYSYFAAEPVEIFEFIAGDKEPFEKLRAVLNKYRIEKTDSQIDNGVFTGGWLGFFSYDFNQYIESIIPTQSDDLKLPLIRLCLYDKVICFDRLENCFYFFALELPDGKNSGEEKIICLENILRQAADSKNDFLLKPCDDFNAGQFSSNMTKDYYLDCIKKIKEYIYNGDVYQINFSQRFRSEIKGSDPFISAELFLWQNKFNPSPYAAYLDSGDYQIISASPELFININAGTITTCPIKGTRPRTHNSDIDKKNYAALETSEKEKAELDMIIDLERNDLGRICKPGSIKVKERRKIETFATVFHAISAIEGKIKAGLDFVDCLKAVFPGGSITGAPKISAMNIISALEPTARGIYTGSIGWIDLKGNANLNIAIRTIIIKAGIAYAQTGGGIVADSVPEAEWHETLVKAKALLTGLTAVNKK